MRFAYADPPYPGQSKRLYEGHPDYAGEVDHRELVERLEADFDAWALSTSAPALQGVIGECPSVRVCIWRKKVGMPRGDHFIYTYEPLLLRGGRRPSGYVSDVIEAISDGLLIGLRQHRSKQYVTGAKPERFCFWLFALAGLRPDDEFHDLFPGSGAVTQAWDKWRSQTRLEVA